MRPVIIALTLVGIAVSTCVHSAAGTARNSRPNLTFILTDDQRYDTLGCTGNAFIKTPNLDRLAADGMFFADASVNSAICMPRRACYFLGQYERRHGCELQLRHGHGTGGVGEELSHASA